MATTSATVAIKPDDSSNRRVHSAGALASMVVSALPGKLHHLAVVNASANARFVQIHDAASLPADTAVPLFSWPIAANGTFELPFGIPVTTGAVVAISSTLATLTISADTATMLALFKV